jgi:hypothetical protein
MNYYVNMNVNTIFLTCFTDETPTTQWLEGVNHG